ncbi:MAG: UDP-glucose--hexose-1-phosphate uridylyltransferase [Armatimonadota bacterium]
MNLELTKYPHRRYNPLLGEWILVSPHRTQRPWQGQTESASVETRPEYDKSCYLCPGNTRASGDVNPDYKSTFVFTNDYSALLTDIPEGQVNKGGLLISESERGVSKVICFSPKHNLTLAKMKTDEIIPIVNVWASETLEIGSRQDIGYVQIFENKGAVMGCSNPHPHGQIWATEHIPNIPAAENDCQKAYNEKEGSCLICDYLHIEQEENERIVCENEHFAVVVPYWATWPFETLLLAKRHTRSIPELSVDERRGLADIIRRITAKYDHVFGVSFPYSMGWHQMPVDGGNYEYWHLHAHFYPPLLRSAEVKKFMVGFEMLAMPQRDITPENAAERLRELPDEW